MRATLGLSPYVRDKPKVRNGIFLPEKVRQGEKDSMENSTEVLTITIDTELKEQIEQIIQPMGISLEQLIIRFLVWCVSEPEQAIDYLQKAKADQK
jgi:hypothetical protein